MEEPKREYNVRSCIVVGVIGALLGALSISGFFFPLTNYILGLVPGGDWGIPPEVFSIACPGVLLGVPLALLLVRFARSRARVRGSGRAEQRSRLSAFMEEDEE